MLLPFLNAEKIEAGCDEAGRGCIAGPVCAAAVILPNDFHHPLLNDSKKMTEKDREIVRPIIEKEGIKFCSLRWIFDPETSVKRTSEPSPRSTKYILPVSNSE